LLFVDELTRPRHQPLEGPPQLSHLKSLGHSFDGEDGQGHVFQDRQQDTDEDEDT